MPAEDAQTANETAAEVGSWTYPDAGQVQVIAISNEALYCGGLPQEEAQRIQAQIKGDVPVDVLLGKRVTKVLVKKVSAVVANEKKSDLRVTYQKLTGFDSLELTFPTQELRNEIFECLKAQFGPKARYKRKEYTPLRAAITPIIVAAFVVAGTWLFASVAAGETEVSATGSPPVDERAGIEAR